MENSLNRVWISAFRNQNSCSFVLEPQDSCSLPLNNYTLNTSIPNSKLKMKWRKTLLRRIPLNVRAISAKNIYQKTTHSTVTF